MVAKKAEKPSGFKLFHFIGKDEIPQRAYPNAIAGTDLQKDMEALAEHIRREGVAPFEGAAEFNITQLKLMGRDDKPLKNPKLTIIAWLKDFMKKQGLDKHLDVVTRGDRIFLEGKSGR